MKIKLLPAECLMLSFILFSFNPYAQGRVLKVGKSGYPYSKITDALNDAKRGDVIKIMDKKVYSEDINIKKSDITIDFNNATLIEFGLKARSVKRVKIKRGTIRNVETGISLVRSSYCVISDMKILRTTRNGIMLWDKCDNNTIRNCHFKHNKGVALHLTKSSYNRLVGNTIRLAYLGIAVSQSIENEILNNVILDSRHEYGIYISNRSQGTKILNNEVRGSEWTGIQLSEQVTGSEAVGNIVLSNHEWGISIGGQSNNNIVINNTITDNWWEGIAVCEDCINTIENNTLENNNIGDPRNPGIQDDAGLGHDATKADPGDFINWGKYSGYLFKNDVNDAYEIPCKANIPLNIVMTPPQGADFDLLLVGSDVWENDYKFKSQKEEVLFTPQEDSFLTVRINLWKGKGTYLLEISIPGDELPTITITSPVQNQTLSGIQPIQTTVNDDIQVAKVEFYIDGILKSTITTSPYTYSWNTESVSNGAHTIKAVVYDNNNQTDFEKISVKVANITPSN